MIVIMLSTRIILLLQSHNKIQQMVVYSNASMPCKSQWLCTTAYATCHTATVPNRCSALPARQIKASSACLLVRDSLS